MANIVKWASTWFLPNKIKRQNSQPLDYSDYFESLDEARAYANGTNTTQGVAYVGQLISVNVGTSDTPNVVLHKIANVAGDLVPVYDEENLPKASVETVGFRGELPPEETTISIKKGYEYLLDDRNISNKGVIVAEIGDYLIYRGENKEYTIPKNDEWSEEVLKDWVILEQNLTGVLKNVSVVDNSQIKARQAIISLSQDGDTLKAVRVPIAVTNVAIADDAKGQVCKVYYDANSGTMTFLKNNASVELEYKLINRLYKHVTADILDFEGRFKYNDTSNCWEIELGSAGYNYEDPIDYPKNNETCQVFINGVLLNYMNYVVDAQTNKILLKNDDYGVTLPFNLDINDVITVSWVTQVRPTNDES